MPSAVKTITITEFLNAGAQLDHDRRYRYALWRIWDNSKPKVLFIGLNPSTADESATDRTLDKCIHFAAAWGYGGVYMANLFAYRATEPEDMKRASDPIGKDNDRWINHCAHECELIIAAWGNHGLFMDRAVDIKRQFNHLYCLKINKSGQPAHPLYQPNTSQYKIYY